MSNVASVPALHPPTVLRLNSGSGQAKHVNHGFFWPTPQTDLGAAFWWDAWVKPLGSGGSVYLVSDGYGGNHSLLWGLGGNAVQAGNIYTGTGNQSFSGTYTFAVGEWAHVAVAWNGSKLRTFVNGICDSEMTFTGPRKAVGNTGGGGILYVGGSDHQNMPCDLAFLRCWDRGDPNPGGHTWAFVPPRWAAPENFNGMPCDFMCDYRTPARILADLSPKGVESLGGPELQASTTKTASFDGAVVDLLTTPVFPGGAKARLLVTAASGTTPTLDAKIQHADASGGPWTDLVAFDQMAATGQQSVLLTPRKRYLRVSATIAGTSPSFTYQVQVQLPPQRHPGRVFDAAQTPAAPSMFGYTGVGEWPGWVVDATCPFGQMLGSPLPEENIPSPAAVPSGCLAFDSFGRRNQTYAFQVSPSLGSTEGGSLGPLAWQTGSPGTASAIPLWGILQGRAVQLSTALAAIAWVPIGTANQDVRVRRYRTGNALPETGVAFRVTDRSNYWWAYMLQGSVYIGRYVAGASTLVNAWAAGSSWDELRVVTSGDTITVYVDNGAGGWTQLGQMTGQTALQTAQGAGLASYGATPSFAHSGARYDNWTAYAA